jgi:hypothetical protein
MDRGMHGKRGHWTYANVMSTLAFAVALLGSATGIGIAAQAKQSGLSAVPGVNGVLSSDIAPNAVKSSDIATNAVKAQEIAADAVKAQELAQAAVQSSNIAQNAIIGPLIDAGAITSSKLAPNSVTDAAVKDLTYTPLTLLHGWHTATGYQTPAYGVDAQGMVHLRGAIQPGISTSDENFADLPSALAPSTAVTAVIAASCPQASPADAGSRYIFSDGVLVNGTDNPPYGGDMATMSLDCGVYYLDQVSYLP